MKYPFQPKTNLKLQRGDYWAVQREDGRFGYYAYLYPFSNRNSMIVALLRITGSEPIISKTNRIEMHKVVMTSVKTFKETNSSILGNIEDRLDIEECEAWKDEFKSNTTVWGYRLMKSKVNEVQPE